MHRLQDILLDQAKQSLPFATAWCQATVNRLGMCGKNERLYLCTCGRNQALRANPDPFKTNIQTCRPLRTPLSETEWTNHRIPQKVLKRLATGTKDGGRSKGQQVRLGNEISQK
jgi:hypothetical protein